MRNHILSLTFFMVTLFSIDLQAAGSLPGSAPSKISPVNIPKQQSPEQPQPYKPLPRPVVPAMEKPFGMPGIVGLRDGKWEGTDYLGYLSKYITINLEVVKATNLPLNIDANSLGTQVENILKADQLVPHARIAEGPPLPFLHILVIVYPTEKDRFVIFCSCRLFEEIHVVRENFKPAGHWQAITWENQDISLASTDQVNAQIKMSVENLVKAFVQRFRLYNPPDLEPGMKPASK